MTSYTVRGRCELCNTDQDVRYEVTRYLIHAPADLNRSASYYFETGARCVDRKACRARVEAAGGDWLVLDPEDEVLHAHGA